MIGLFPLSLVLFPESAIQLHVFEERYKNLINDCLADNSEFGINVILFAKIQDVGCTAKVVEVLKRYADGKMDILVRGIRRYNLISKKVSDREYLIGKVDFLDDKTEYPNSALIEECIIYYNRIAEEVKSLRLEKIDNSMFFSMTPSFFFAQKAGLSNEQKYYLLQQQSENERLRFLLDHLKKIEPFLKESEYLSTIIKNDGYTDMLRK
jgi:Lon protease-like protein